MHCSTEDATWIQTEHIVMVVVFFEISQSCPLYKVQKAIHNDNLQKQIREVSLNRPRLLGGDGVLFAITQSDRRGTERTFSQVIILVAMVLMVIIVIMFMVALAIMVAMFSMVAMVIMVAMSAGQTTHLSIYSLFI